jgi:hypothetical protein
MGIIIVGFLLAVMTVTSSHSSSSNVITTGPTGSSSSSTSTTVVTKSQVRVQVANGTSINGLAHSVTARLMTLGWDTLAQLNGPHVTKTVIYFNPGFKWAARDIASTIGLSDAAVQPLNGQNPVQGASGDDVVVILGPDASQG